MGKPVFANGMEVSSKSMSGKSICQFPDVCFTPPQTPATPPGVPIPYPNTGMAGDTTEGSKTVVVNGQEIMLKDRSCFKKSTGDEAGAAPKKGLINSKTKGKVYFLAWSMDVKIEGENAVRNLDLTTHNHASKPANGAVPTAHVAKAAAGKKAKKQDPCRHRRGKKKKKYVVYHAPVVDANGKPTGQIYVGRTRGPPNLSADKIVANRHRNHHRTDIGTPQAVCETTSYAACRGAEEKHQKHFAALGKSPTKPKQINPISPKNPRKDDYIACAEKTNAPTCGICGA